MDIAKIDSSPVILKFIETLIQVNLDHVSINNQERQKSDTSDRVLFSVQIVRNVPNLFEIVALKNWQNCTKQIILLRE